VINDLKILDVDANAVARILALEESHFLDLKAQEITPEKLAIHAMAFANSAGGELYVGIDDPKSGGPTWRGFATIEAANAHVQTINDRFQGNNLVSATFLRGAGVSGFVLHLIIEKSREIVQTVGGDIYKRVSAQKLPVKLTSHAEVERLRLDKGLASYEDVPVAGVNVERSSDSLAITEFIIAAVPVSEALPWLTSQRLIVNSQPSVAEFCFSMMNHKWFFPNDRQ